MYHHFEAAKLRSCHTLHKQIHDEKRSNNKSNTNAIKANLHLVPSFCVLGFSEKKSYIWS